jgi:hypothetical protein
MIDHSDWMNFRLRQALGVAAALVLVGGVFKDAGADDVIRPISIGSYCSLPEPGEKPACLDPAQATYPDFFASVEDGQLDSDSASRLEADLMADPGSEDAYLALSSLAYGYLRISSALSASPDASPALSARLLRWNGLLSSTYAEDSAPEHFRSALREAADDIHSRVGRFGARCGTASEECSSGLVLALERVDRGGPLRAPLRGLINRFRRDEENR